MIEKCNVIEKENNTMFITGKEMFMFSAGKDFRCIINDGNWNDNYII